MTGRKTSPAARAHSKPNTKRDNLPPADARHRMIAEAAYYRAERRGFGAGDPVADWLAAEDEIDNNRNTSKTRSRARVKK